MKLYSFQPTSVVEYLQKHGEIVNNPALSQYLGDDGMGFDHGYDWLHKKVRELHPDWDFDGGLWWAWIDKPDLRTHRHYYDEDEEYCLLHLEIPDDEVQIIQTHIWNLFGLSGNSEFIPSNEWESKYQESLECMMDFDEFTKRSAGSNWYKTAKNENLFWMRGDEVEYICDNTKEFIEWMRAMARWSRDKMFHPGIEAAPLDPEYWGDDYEAVFPRLKREYIKQIRRFRGAAKR